MEMWGNPPKMGIFPKQEADPTSARNLITALETNSASDSKVWEWRPFHFQRLTIVLRIPAEKS
jgi:hypothetical protein